MPWISKDDLNLLRSQIDKLSERCDNLRSDLNDATRVPIFKLHSLLYCDPETISIREALAALTKHLNVGFDVQSENRTVRVSERIPIKIGKPPELKKPK